MWQGLSAVAVAVAVGILTCCASPVEVGTTYIPLRYDDGEGSSTYETVGRSQQVGWRQLLAAAAVPT